MMEFFNLRNFDKKDQYGINFSEPVNVEIFSPAPEEYIFKSAAFFEDLRKFEDAYFLDVLTAKNVGFTERARIDLQGITILLDDLREISSMEIRLTNGKADWQVKPDLITPVNPINSRILFVDPVNKHFGGIEGLYSNAAKTMVYIKIWEKPANTYSTYRIADNLFLDVHQERELIGIWIFNIQDDPKGKRRKEWSEKHPRQ